MKKVFVKTYGCQMNVYDSERMADALAADGYAETEAIEEADLVLLNTCHIREKAAEKVYSELGRLRELKEERERARAGARWSPSPAASPRPRARRSCAARRPSTWWSARRAITACPSCCTNAARGERVVETDFPVEDKFDHLPAAPRPRSAAAASPPSSPCRKAATSSAPSASCPIRAARRSRAPVAQIVGRGASAWPTRGVREITLLGQNVNAYHGEGPDGAAVVAWPPAASPGRDPRPRAAALHHQPSARHGRRPDRRASRPARADALSAPAGAVGLRPHPRGHEPQAHGATTICRLIERIRAARPGHRAVGGLHRRLSRRDRRRFRGDVAARGRGRLRQRLLVQIQPAPRHAGGRDRGRCRRR